MISRNKFIVLTVDLVLLFLSYLAAYWLRIESIDSVYWVQFQKTVLPVVVVKMFIFSYLGLHAGPWRYTGVLDLINIAKASALGFAVLMVGMIYFYYPINFSRSVFVIDAINTVALVGMFRLSIRLAYSRQLLEGVLERIVGAGLWSRKKNGSKRVLVYGADERGEMLLGAIISSQEKSSSKPVGVIDDDPNRKGVIIHGVRHIGTSDDLGNLIQKYHVSELMIASEPGKEVMRKIFDVCQQENVSCRLIPPYLDTMHRGFGVLQLRNIEIEDLLRRESVKIEHSQVKEMIFGKRVLVTGAAGSIGRQLCLQVLEFEPSEMVCLDHGENPLFFLKEEVKGLSQDLPTFFYCSDVTNREKMTMLFEKHKPQIVLHAAAHKHVPLMEFNMDEVMYNNVGGTKIVADMADRYGSETFVFISTDKAVQPANVMGWTKRMGEVYTQYLSASSKTKYISVRFGNVLGSNGSVVPIFRKQIENGGPLLVTHQDATRYFMTIPEAVLLILQSMVLGEQGDIMILDMGEPVKIVELAQEMIHLAGYTPGKDIEVKITGLRPGEKMHEILMSDLEELKPTSHKKITIVKGNSYDTSEIPSLVSTVLEKSYSDPQVAYSQLKNGLKEVGGIKAKTD